MINCKTNRNHIDAVSFCFSCSIWLVGGSNLLAEEGEEKKNPEINQQNKRTQPSPDGLQELIAPSNLILCCFNINENQKWSIFSISFVYFKQNICIEITISCAGPVVVKFTVDKLICHRIITNMLTTWFAQSFRGSLTRWRFSAANELPMK